VGGLWRAFKPLFPTNLIDFSSKIAYNMIITGFAGGQEVVKIAFSLSLLC
jgi:hypothetical protein